MDKRTKYQETAQEIAGVIDGERSAIARFATAACLLHNAFAHYFWTGFYLVDETKTDELVIGPYQGTLGCLRIGFDRGVCGAAAKTGKTQVVKDVHAFPGHIACDARSNSEIVVPVYWDSGKLAGVLDVDSTQIGAFDDIDKQALEEICASLLTGAT